MWSLHSSSFRFILRLFFSFYFFFFRRPSHWCVDPATFFPSCRKLISLSPLESGFFPSQKHGTTKAGVSPPLEKAHCLAQEVNHYLFFRSNPPQFRVDAPPNGPPLFDSQADYLGASPLRCVFLMSILYIFLYFFPVFIFLFRPLKKVWLPFFYD